MNQLGTLKYEDKYSLKPLLFKSVSRFINRKSTVKLYKLIRANNILNTHYEWETH